MKYDFGSNLYPFDANMICVDKEYTEEEFWEGVEDYPIASLGYIQADLLKPVVLPEPATYINMGSFLRNIELIDISHVAENIKNNIANKCHIRIHDSLSRSHYMMALLIEKGLDISNISAPIPINFGLDFSDIKGINGSPLDNIDHLNQADKAKVSRAIELGLTFVIEFTIEKM